MNILYFNNGSGLGTAKSGGTTRLIETARVMQKKGVGIHIVTTQGCYTLFKQEKLKAHFYMVRASIFKQAETGAFDRITAYIISTIHSCMIALKLPLTDIVYSPSDYYCDVIPSFVYKLIHKQVKWTAMIHHLCRPPMQRKGSFIINMLSYVSQKLSFSIINIYCDKILVYDTPEGKAIADIFIKKGFDKNKISYVWNGINIKQINAVKKTALRYEACFAGGLRASKGIYEIIPIWQQVVQAIPKARIVMAGAGSRDIEEDFRKKIKTSGLEKNIILVGALKPDKLYALIKQSALFISTSLEEGWGIAVSEALACGTPVIAYDLPAFKFLKDTVVKIKIGNRKSFSRSIVELLKISNKRKLLSRQGRQFIKKYDWRQISQTELQLMKAVTSF